MPLPPVIEPPELKRFSGMQRAAALMLALGKENGATIWQQLALEEVKRLTKYYKLLGSYARET